MVSKSQGKGRKGTRDTRWGRGCSYRTKGKRRGVGSTWVVCRVTEADEAWEGGRDSLGAGREQSSRRRTVTSKGPCKVSQGAKECALGGQQGRLGGGEKELGGGAEGKQG